eukprot:Rmarinus@m.7005
MLLNSGILFILICFLYLTEIAEGDVVVGTFATEPQWPFILTARSTWMRKVDSRLILVGDVADPDIGILGLSDNEFSPHSVTHNFIGCENDDVCKALALILSAYTSRYDDAEWLVVAPPIVYMWPRRIEAHLNEVKTPRGIVYVGMRRNQFGDDCTGFNGGLIYNLSRFFRLGVPFAISRASLFRFDPLLENPFSCEEFVASGQVVPAIDLIPRDLTLSEFRASEPVSALNVKKPSGMRALWWREYLSIHRLHGLSSSGVFISSPMGNACVLHDRVVVDIRYIVPEDIEIVSCVTLPKSFGTHYTTRSPSNSTLHIHGYLPKNDGVHTLPTLRTGAYELAVYALKRNEIYEDVFQGRDAADAMCQHISGHPERYVALSRQMFFALDEKSLRTILFRGQPYELSSVDVLTGISCSKEDLTLEQHAWIQALNDPEQLPVDRFEAQCPTSDDSFCPLKVPLIYFHDVKSGGTLYRHMLFRTAETSNCSYVIPIDQSRMPCQTFDKELALVNCTRPARIYAGHFSWRILGLLRLIPEYESLPLWPTDFRQHHLSNHLEYKKSSSERIEVSLAGVPPAYPASSFACKTTLRHPVTRTISYYYERIYSRQNNRMLNEFTPEELRGVLSSFRDETTCGPCNSFTRMFMGIGMGLGMECTDVPFDEIPWDSLLRRVRTCTVSILERPETLDEPFKYSKLRSNRIAGAEKLDTIRTDLRKVIEDVNQADMFIYQKLLEITDEWLRIAPAMR